jgi:hypothetical protein
MEGSDMRHIRFALLLLATSCGTVEPDAPPPLRASVDFPGGSATFLDVDSETRTIRLESGNHPGRGSFSGWFFKVDGLRPGERLRIDMVVRGTFGKRERTPDRAVVSWDGRSWRPTEPGIRTDSGILYAVVAESSQAWFAWAPPYQLQQAREAVSRSHPCARAFELCTSAEGRSVPGVEITQTDAPDRYGIWIQARQHAWECVSSWVAQGFLDWILSDDPRAEALRKKALIVVIPIMDVDNVERGAGGKGQLPNDHNQDWSDEPHWPEVRAAIGRIRKLSDAGRFDVFIDSHNPWAGTAAPMFMTPPPERISERRRGHLDRFLGAVREEMTGPLRFSGETNPDTTSRPRWDRNSKNWVVTHTPDHVVSVTLETAWNTPHASPENYLRVGRELGLSLERYFRAPPR